MENENKTLENRVMFVVASAGLAGGAYLGYQFGAEHIDILKHSKIHPSFLYEGVVKFVPAVVGLPVGLFCAATALGITEFAAKYIKDLFKK